jgi:hypothetical protein
MNVKILDLNNEFEAKLLDEILTAKNIPHLIRSYHDSVYDGLWQMQSAWGHVESPAEYRDEIILIYAEMSRVIPDDENLQM